MSNQKIRIGYVPFGAKLDRPGDYRRFPAYARARGLAFELAHPEEVYDLVVLSEEADVSAWSDYPHGKIVYDLIDSFLAIPRSNIKQWLRGPIWYITGRQRRLKFNQWAAIQAMCRRADAVVCTTDEQRQDILSYCSNIHIVLDMHDSIISQIKSDYHCDETFQLVWEGLPSNITQLRGVSGALREIDRSRPLVLNVLTDPSQPRLLGRYGKIMSIDLAREMFDKVVFHPWNKDTFSKIICGCDLAIIPIDLSDPFVTGKPENKLLLLWRMGMPVVTSATPAYLRAMYDAGLKGMVCRDHEEWMVALKHMISDENLRREVGCFGHDFVESTCSEEMLLSRWDKVFASIGFFFVSNSI